MVKNLVLYDNAGEHFEPGRDSVTNPATNHLVHSHGIMFLFDPSRDARMVPKCNPDDPQIRQPGKLVNQETLFAEMISRLRRHGGMRATQKYEKPLVIVLAKSDMWEFLLPPAITTLEFCSYDEETMTHKMDMDKIMTLTYHARKLLSNFIPELISTAESFAREVYYIPVSSLGCAPELIDTTGGIGIKPCNINPKWVELPLLVLLSLHGYIKMHSPQSTQNTDLISKYRITGDAIVFEMPGKKTRVQLPCNFLGHRIFMPEMGKWIKFPDSPDNVEKAQIADSDSDNFWDK